MRRALMDQDIKPTSRIAAQLGDDWDVTVGVAGDEDALVRALADVDVLFTTSRLPVTARVLDESDLRLVAKIGTGIDNIDLEAARRFGVPVTYTPGFNAFAVAEHTVALMLATRRRVVQYRDVMAAGGWRDDVPLGSTLHGKTVGIVGFGQIGRRVGSLLSGFHPELLAHDPYILEIDVEQSGATLVELDALLERSDVVSINAELTEETRGLIGRRELDRMRDDAILVNTARGPIVDQASLVSALETDELAGAGLDVFETEPVPPDSPLFDLPNVVTTPHAAGHATESRHRTMDILVRNALALLEGRDVPDHFLAVPPA